MSNGDNQKSIRHPVKPTKLTLNNCHGDGTWWIIELAHHDGKEWMEPTRYGSAYMHSARFSDADVEGPPEHILGIAHGIETRQGAHYKRCAVEIQGNRALFSSPRNSSREGVVTLEEADNLAQQIRALLGDVGAK